MYVFYTKNYTPWTSITKYNNNYLHLQYSALEVGTTGAGGEYVPQTGFGWTNGIVFELFRRWGNILRSV